MIVKFILLCFLSIRYFEICYGTPDIPFFDDFSVCSERTAERIENPYFEFEKPLLPFEKRMITVFYPDMQIPIANLRPFSESNDQDFQYVAGSDSPDDQLRLRKRSVTGTEENTKSDNSEPNQYESSYLSPMRREFRDKASIKTIHLPSSFTPRLGRKRSEEIESPKNNDNYRPNGISGRSRVIDLKAGSAFTPRLGRNEGGANRIHLFAGNAFTPRLGRSEGSNTIRFNAGSAFTPRLGRSNHLNKVLLNAGGAFTPRLGRSEGNYRIHLNAGSAFTPRLGRSEGSRMFLNAGNSFTPRLGRSGTRNKIQLNAGGAFTPRLG